MTRRPADPHTIAARTGVDSDTAHGAVMPPLYLSSNYSFAGFDQKRKYDYSRSGNPTRDVLAETLAELEGGAGCVVTATGMAAVDLPLSLLQRCCRWCHRYLYRSPQELWWSISLNDLVVSFVSLIQSLVKH